MKIMQIIPSFAFGGAEVMCENLVYSLIELGNTVEVVSLFSSHTPISERMEERGVNIVYLDKKPGFDFSVISKLKKEIKKFAPDAVHVHLNAIKYAGFAVKKTKVKKCVYTVHNIAEKDASGFSRKLNAIFFKKKWVQPVALSETVKESISRLYGIELESIPSVYNGIDLEKCRAKENYKLGDPIKLIHIGRFFEQKNHKGMLEIFAKLKQSYPNICLQLVGDGELKSEMEAYAEELGIKDSVEFMGAKANVHEFLSEADIFILPSIYEGMPITLIEAMGSGMPIVATAVGGVPDMLSHNESAMLVKCDTDSIYDACVELLESEEKRAALGKAALGRSERFSSKYMAEKYCEIYNS